MWRWKGKIGPFRFFSEVFLLGKCRREIQTEFDSESDKSFIIARAFQLRPKSDIYGAA